MIINPLIKQILEEYHIDVDVGTLALLAIHFKLSPIRIIDEETIKAINLTKIVDVDYNLRTITWNVSMFEDTESGSFGWVYDWVHGFKRRNPDRAGSWRDAMTRMQDFFRKYPQYRRIDVYAARDMYLSRIRDPQYIMHSHKFIFDGQGAMKKSTLLQYCELMEAKKGEGSDSGMRGKIL